MPFCNIPFSHDHPPQTNPRLEGLPAARLPQMPTVQQGEEPQTAPPNPVHSLQMELHLCSNAFTYSTHQKSVTDSSSAIGTDKSTHTIQGN